MSIFDSFNNMLFRGGNNNLFNFGNFNKNRSYNYRCIYKLINLDEARNMILENKVLLLDVRSKNEFDMVKIKNSINVPVDQIESNIFNIEPEKNKSIMVYCASGHRSRTAINILNRMGYRNIYIWDSAALSTFPYKDMLVYGSSNY